MASAMPQDAQDDIVAGMHDDVAFAAEIGDMSEEEVLAEALAEYDADPREIVAAVGLAFLEKRAREAAFPAVTDCDRLDAAFAALRKDGFVAVQAAGASLEDGMSMIQSASEQEENEDCWAFVFFHMEDVEKAIDHGRMHLAFGVIPTARGERAEWPAEIAGDVVQEALQEAGLQTVWDGTPGRRIQVHMCWQRRCPGAQPPRLMN